MSRTIPMLELRDETGSRFDWSPLWQRKNLLLLFPHPGCEVCRQVMERWEEKVSELEAENTIPVAVVRETGEALPDCMRVAVDPGDRLATRLGVSPGTVVVADRFFEVLQKEGIHDLGADRTAADTVGWIHLAEMRCPECGIGTW